MKSWRGERVAAGSLVGTALVMERDVCLTVVPMTSSGDGGDGVPTPSACDGIGCCEHVGGTGGGNG